MRIHISPHFFITKVYVQPVALGYGAPPEAFTDIRVVTRTSFSRQLLPFIARDLLVALG